MSQRLLEGLGIASAEEATYRALLRHGPATFSQLASETAFSVPAIRRMLPRLEELGLVTRVAGRPLRLIATPPSVAIDILAARRQKEIAHSRTMAAVLVEEITDRSKPHPEEALEVVTGRDAVAWRYLQLEQNSTEEMLVLVHPPYAVDIRDDREKRKAACNGARARGIYGPQAFEEPGMLEHTRRSIADGEQARLGNVPVKLAIADGRTALLPLLSTENRAVDSALVVHPSALLDALVGLFEALWRAAVPLRLVMDSSQEVLQTEAWPQAADMEVLSLLAMGMKDDAIARRLGLSPRTVQRRVRVLSERLGARTRFHAGLLAAEQGLLNR